MHSAQRNGCQVYNFRHVEVKKKNQALVSPSTKLQNMPILTITLIFIIDPGFVLLIRLNKVIIDLKI